MFEKFTSGVTTGWQVGKMPQPPVERGPQVEEDFELPIFIITLTLMGKTH